MSKKRIDAEAVLQRVIKEGPDAQMSCPEVTALIASRTKKPTETVRHARNRIRMQIVADLERDGDVTEGGLVCLPNGKFQTDEIRRWIIGKYGKELFPDLPGKRRDSDLSAESFVGVKDTASYEELPNTIRECHELIRQLKAEIVNIRLEFAQADAARRAKLSANLKGK